jgi:hypothetical protein
LRESLLRQELTALQGSSSVRAESDGSLGIVAHRTAEGELLIQM